jgi:hypothetical protein
MPGANPLPETRHQEIETTLYQDLTEKRSEGM